MNKKIAPGAALLLAFTGLTNTVQASDWFNIAHSSTAQLEVDRASISVMSSGERKAWVSYVLEQPQAWSDGRNYRKALLLKNYRCGDQMLVTKNIVVYENTTDPSPMDSYTTPVPKYENPVPDSLNDIELNFVCNAKVARK
jgi:hypothetical protein